MTTRYSTWIAQPTSAFYKPNWLVIIGVENAAYSVKDGYTVVADAAIAIHWDGVYLKRLCSFPRDQYKKIG